MGENIDLLVKELCKLPAETGWLEFKENNCDPMMIGADISALANSATLLDHDCAYMIWGVEDDSHNIRGLDDDVIEVARIGDALQLVGQVV